MENLVELLIGGTNLAVVDVAILLGVSFLGSFITVSMGIGGGGLVVATMALILPPPILIPVHGVVQLGSNFGRALLMLRDVNFAIVPVFLIGTIIGAAIGGQLVVSLPVSVLQAVLAGFILYTTWAPKFSSRSPGKRTFFGLGAIGAFVTMFVGATGPLVATFVATACKERQTHVATHATLMSIQHGLKVVAFGLLGFSFGPYLPLLAGLLVFGFAGTYIGRLVLMRLPEAMFRTGLKIVLTLIALRLLYGAITS